jgi:hypothetical protein
MLSVVIKPLNFLLLFPIIAIKFSTDEIALWFLFGTIITLQNIADFGFYNTFVRLISLSLSGGCHEINDLNQIEDEKRIIRKENIQLTAQIVSTMRIVYNWLSFVLFILLIMSSLFLKKNISLIENPNEGWAAWICIIIGSSFNFLNRKYTNFLLAQNKVSLVKLLESIVSLLGLISNITIVYFFKSIFLLILSNQCWIVIGSLIYRYAANRKNNLSYHDFKKSHFNKSIFYIAFPLACKSGISFFMSQGITNFSGIIYAQFADSKQISTYLMAIKIITIIRLFAQSPFYSTIPLLVSLRGKNDLESWKNLAQKKMFYSSMLLVSGIIICDIIASGFFKYIKSDFHFPDHYLWLTLGIAYILHLYGSMHTQLYTTLNKVNSHISDMISGIIMICFWTLFYKSMGIYVFAIGMIIAYLSFYIWYSGYYSYKYIDISPIKFEIRANLIPISIGITYAMIVLFDIK